MNAADFPAPRRAAQVRTWELILFQALFAILLGTMLLHDFGPQLSLKPYHPIFYDVAASVAFIAFLPGEWGSSRATRFTWHGRLAIISNGLLGLIPMMYLLQDRPHVHDIDGWTDGDMAARGLPPVRVLCAMFVLTAIAAACGVKSAWTLREQRAWVKWLPLLASTLQAACLIWLTPFL